MGSNNIHFNFPAIMNDSRNFTEFESLPALDDKIKKSKNLNNSEYRKFLQTNADMIIRSNQVASCNECSACPYINNPNQHTIDSESNSPYIFKTILSNNQPYGYESSDLKNIYLSRQQLEAQLNAPKFAIPITK
jgi:hypothetical protein